MQSGGWGLKNPHCRPLFSNIWQFKEKQWPGTSAILALRFYNRCNHARLQGPHMWLSPGPGPDSKCSKTVEAGCSCYELKPSACHCEIVTDKIQEEENYREHSNITSACQCTDGLSATQSGLAAAEVSTLCRNRTQVARLYATHLNHSAIDWCWSAKKPVYDSSYYLKCFATCTAFLLARLSFSDSSGWISRPGMIYQNSWAKPLIDKSYRIRHRWELPYFHFSQVLLNAHLAAHRPRKSENSELEI